MQTDSRLTRKTPICVEISLTEGSIIYGMVFTTPKGRLIDVLNDDRDFLPVETLDGSVLAIAKKAIKQVALPDAEAPVYRGSDPYLILGVPKGVSEEKLKAAYRQLCLNNHPDRIRGFGLGADFLELATTNMVRINNAFAHISRTKNKVGGDAFDVDREPATDSSSAARRR